jgi:ketosteroid isomerase-like protein
MASTETMVLRSGADGWKIVHIHWSSHVMKAE